MTFNQLDVCQWCETPVYADATGPREPAVDGRRWWHQGCLADLMRASQEVENFYDRA